MVVKVDGKDVTRDQTLSYIVANVQPGKRIPIELIRDGRRMTVTATVGQRPTEEQLAQIGGGGSATPEGSAPGATAPQRALGLGLATLTPEAARAANLPATARGVIITAVEPGSDAQEEGLQRGDLIMSVNRQPVTTPAQVMAAAENARRAGRNSVLLLVKRGAGQEAFIAVEFAAR